MTVMATTVEQDLALAAWRIRQRDWAGAQAICRRVLDRHPRLAEAHYNLAIACRAAGRIDEAIAAYHQAIACRPAFAAAFNNLGNLLKARGEVDAATDCFHRALTIDPRFAAAWNNLGAACKMRGELDEARQAIDRARAIEPHNVELHSNHIYLMQFCPQVTSADVAREMDAFDARFSRAEPDRRASPPAARNAPGGARLRIGYVSPYFREHCQAMFLLPLLANHDRQRIEIVCYSDVAEPDAVTDRLRARADLWRDTHRLSHAELAEVIRADGVDILVDLTLHMAGNRLPAFARRPARRQVSWLGYPARAGLSAIDYRLIDPHLDPVDPGDGKCAPDRPIHLPDTFWCYDPMSPPIDAGELPALGEGAITFGCLNNFCKVNDGVLGLWAQVIRAVPRSRLLLLCPEGAARQRVCRTMGDIGVAADRIEFVPFAPRNQYLETYRRIDIGLDTFPYNGHTTSLDSLWMGVPVITLVGDTPVGRAGLSQLCNLGLPEWTAATPEEFVRIAVERVGDLHALHSLRQSLRRRMELSPLMDAPRFARGIESAYLQIAGAD